MLFNESNKSGLAPGNIFLISADKSKLPIMKSGPIAPFPISLKLIANKTEPKNGDNSKDNIPIARFE
jgi:hypothetical protein